MRASAWPLAMHAVFLFYMVEGSVPFSELVDERLWDELKKRLPTATTDEVNYVDGTDRRGLLHWVNLPGRPQPEILKLALSVEGVIVDPVDADGCTPLVWAVHNNHYDQAQMLLEAGADVLHRDEKNRTVKDHAATSKIKGLIKTWERKHSALPIGADEDEDDATLFVKHLELANWAELVDGTADRDMLLYFFAPWCGHCRDFSPTFDELGNSLGRMTSIVLAKMDVSSEKPPVPYDVRSLPAIYLRNFNVASTPILFEGKRTIEELLGFVKVHGGKRYILANGEDQLKASEAAQADTDTADGAPNGVAAETTPAEAAPASAGTTPTGTSEDEELLKKGARALRDFLRARRSVRTLRKLQDSFELRLAKAESRMEKAFTNMRALAMHLGIDVPSDESEENGDGEPSEHSGQPSEAKRAAAYRAAQRLLPTHHDEM